MGPGSGGGLVKSVRPVPGGRPGPVKSVLAGGVGGVCVIATGYPLDTIKVRLQTQPKPAPGQPPVFRGMLDCGYKTIKIEGFTGLYKGMLSPLLYIVPLFALSFFGYWTGQRLQQSKPTDPLTVRQHMKAGLVAGVFTAIIQIPGERLKCLMQVQQASGREGKYKGSIDCAKQLYREGGIRNLYQGTVITLIRVVPCSAVYFGSYEWCSRTLTPAGKTRQDLSPGRVLLAGGSAGMANWAVAIAPDTLKSRLQTAPSGKYNGVRDIFREMMRTEGPLALFRGLTPVMIRAFPANAAGFLGYETAIHVLNMLW